MIFYIYRLRLNKRFFTTQFVLFVFFVHLFAQSVSLQTDRARVTIQNIPDAYNPTGPKLKVLRSDANTPLRAGSVWIWNKAGREEQPESYYALMASKGLNAVRMILFDTWEHETYTTETWYVPTDWNDVNYRTKQLARMERAVNFASKYGMYVIINSHNHIPSYFEAYTSALWTYVAPYFANRTHVLYELANEPMSGIGKNGDMDMGAAGATTSPRLQALKRGYDIARAGAPNTMLMILTPSGINDYAYGTGLGNLAASFAMLPGTVVDWNKTAVAYHLYANDAAYGAATNAKNLRNLHQRYAGWPSENSFPASVNVFQGDNWRSQSFDNDLYVNQTCEKLGLGWAMWFINGTEQFNANFPTMWADAVAKGWTWVKDVTSTQTVNAFEAETNFTVASEVGANGTIVPYASSACSNGIFLTLYDINDKAKITFTVAKAGDYNVNVRLRSGYTGASTSNVDNKSYLLTLDGVVSTYAMVAGSLSSIDGDTYWATVQTETRTLTAGVHTIDIKALADWLKIDYVQPILTQDIVKPTAPTNLSSTNINTTGCKLTWTASTDNIRVTGYDIFKGATLLGTSSTTTFDVTGLTPGSTSSITVVAKDAAGNASNSSTALSVTTNDADVTIPNTTSAPVIDGTKEATWKGTPIAIGKVSSGSIANAADLSGNWTAMWDNTNLYIFGSVADNLISASSPVASWWNDDRFEIFIDAAFTRSTTYGAKQYQYYVRPGESALTETKLSAVANTQVAYKVVTGGYTFEIKIPFATLGITPSLNLKMGMDVQIGDNDGTVAHGKLAWYATIDNSWQNPSLFGIVKLGAWLVTGLNDNTTNELISIYPNPATNKLTISNLPIGSVVSVVGLDAKIISSQIVNGSALSYDVSDWNKGVYLFKIKEKNTVIIKKVIIN